MSETEQLQQRLMKLEELFSHQEHLVGQLNEAVIRLRADLAAIEAKSIEQEGQIRRLAENQESADSPVGEKPPHY